MQHELHCPACNSANRFSEAQMIDGLENGCTHCRAALVLSREWDEFDNQYRWQLIASVDDSEDET